MNLNRHPLFMGEKMKKLSILLSLYDKEQPAFLSEALASIRLQSIWPTEIVVVFDGPINRGLERTFEEGVKGLAIPVKVVKLRASRGLGVALHAGLEHCECEYVMRVDTDDINRPDRIERQLNFAMQHPEVAAFGGWIEEFSITPGDLRRVRKTPCTYSAVRKCALSRNPINHMTVVFRRESVLQAGSYVELKGLEDYHLWFRMLNIGMQLANMPEVLVFARINSGTIARRRGFAYLKREEALFREMLEEGFITRFRYYLNLTIRSILRLIPSLLLSGAYRWVFRYKRVSPI